MSSIRFTWWNLQNFFDTDDDPISKDFEFTAAEGWTQEVFDAKKTNLAAALNATHGGAGPELLAVCEIEKDELNEQLVAQMGNPNLQVANDRSGTRDLRGIDVALAFDKTKLKLKSDQSSVHSHLVHLRYRTRDIREVEFEVKDTQETLVVLANHWPSRRPGRYRTGPLRAAVAEHLAYPVEAHVKLEPEQYEALRDVGDLGPVLEKWETKVLVAGDFNDEPFDRSLVDHLRGSHDLDRVVGATNDIDGFQEQTADYRGQDVFLYNARDREGDGNLLHRQRAERREISNRYQVLEQIVASRGLVSGSGLTLNLGSVAIFRDPLVAATSGRPRGFSKTTKKGTSGHLPVTALLEF